MTNPESASRAFLESVLARCDKDGHNVDKVRGAVAPYLNECDAFDVASALYWFGADYHSGQFSLGYALNCAVSLEGYNPGRLERGPDGIALEIYNALGASELGA